jgi:hypothetical protein
MVPWLTAPKTMPEGGVEVVQFVEESLDIAGLDSALRNGIYSRARKIRGGIRYQ